MNETNETKRKEKATEDQRLPELEVHEKFTKLLPLLRPEEVELIEADAQANGQVREKAAVWRGKLVAGDTYYRIARKHGAAIDVVELEFDDEDQVRVWVISDALIRRHLNKYNRIRLALKLKDSFRALAERNQAWRSQLLANLAKDKTINTRSEIANVQGRSHGCSGGEARRYSARSSGGRGWHLQSSEAAQTPD